MNYLPRAIESTFLRLSNSFGAVLVTGSRQVGKTTMLQHLAAEEGRSRSYVSLDDLQTRALAKSDPRLFLQAHPAPVIIDEVQYAPELFIYLKINLDSTKAIGDYWLTGSQEFALMKGVSESLAGRVGLLRMYPFSQSELYRSDDSQPFDLDRERLAKLVQSVPAVAGEEIFRRIFEGGMPDVVTGKTARQDFYSSYLNTYIERDVRDYANIGDSLKFLTFLSAVAARAAQEVNYQSLARDCDIDQATVKRWLRILEALGIIFYLHPLSNNALKRVIKSPKLYFTDTALATYLSRWESVQALAAGPMSGAALENYTISEIRKSYHNAGQEPFLWYYRDTEQREIDLVIERSGKYYPMEIKQSTAPSPSITKAFKVLDGIAYTHDANRGNGADKKRGTGAILCLAQSLSAFDSDNLVVPIAYL